jgi:hypothetical protein
MAGLRVGQEARNAEKLAPLAADIGAETFTVDASDPAAVARLFAEATTRSANPMSCSTTPVPAHGPIAERDPEARAQSD